MLLAWNSKNDIVKPLAPASGIQQDYCRNRGKPSAFHVELNKMSSMPYQQNSAKPNSHREYVLPFN